MREAPCNVRRATVDGDVDTAVAAGKALEGEGTGGKARSTDFAIGCARKPGEPQGRQQDATSLRAPGGATRQGGEKPRSRNESPAWQREAEGSMSPSGGSDAIHSARTHSPAVCCTWTPGVDTGGDVDGGAIFEEP